MAALMIFCVSAPLVYAAPRPTNYCYKSTNFVFSDRTLHSTVSDNLGNTFSGIQINLADREYTAWSSSQGTASGTSLDSRFYLSSDIFEEDTINLWSYSAGTLSGTLNLPIAWYFTTSSDLNSSDYSSGTGTSTNWTFGNTLINIHMPENTTYNGTNLITECINPNLRQYVSLSYDLNQFKSNSEYWILSLTFNNCPISLLEDNYIYSLYGVHDSNLDRFYGFPLFNSLSSTYTGLIQIRQVLKQIDNFNYGSLSVSNAVVLEDPSNPLWEHYDPETSYINYQIDKISKAGQNEASEQAQIVDEINNLYESQSAIEEEVLEDVIPDLDDLDTVFDSIETQLNSVSNHSQFWVALLNTFASNLSNFWIALVILPLALGTFVWILRY